MNKNAFLGITDRSWPLLRRAMGLHTFPYRTTNGRIGRRIPGVPAPILLLDHIGAKSGVKRTSPLSYIPDGDDVVLIAAKGVYQGYESYQRRTEREIPLVILEPRKAQR